MVLNRAYGESLASRQNEGEALSSTEIQELNDYQSLLEEERFQEDLAKRRIIGLGFLIAKDPVGDIERAGFFKSLASFWLPLEKSCSA